LTRSTAVSGQNPATANPINRHSSFEIILSSRH
jgi:hypothetical protein